MIRSYIFLLSLGLVLAVEQTFTVKGTVNCFGEPVPNAAVDLRFIDRVHKGEILATVNTDDEGRFTVVGSKDLDDLEDDKLRVYLEISSNCDKEQREGCDVVTAVGIPSNQPDYEVAALNLEKRAAVMNSCADDESY